MRLSTLLVAVALASATSFGQPAPIPAVSPVPIWPADGRVPPELRTHSVFFDPAASEILVVLDAAAGNAPSNVLRFGPRNQSETNVLTRVSRVADGLYVYEYTLAVASRSRQPLDQWSLLIPAEPTRLAVPPVGWGGRRESTDLVDRGVPGPGFLEFLRFSPAKGNEVAPGRAVAPFRVSSRYRPGYVTSFSSSTATREIPAERLASLPAGIANQIKEVSAPHWNNHMTTVLGPRFAPDTPGPVIAACFHYSIEYLVTEKRLSGNSEFVKAALAALRFRLESGTDAALAQSELTFLGAAKTPDEKEVADALRLSLVSVY